MRYNLSELCDIIGGGTPKTNIPQYWGGNIPWLSVKDFNNDRKYVYEAEKAITEEGLNNSAATTLIKGDIIISARGTVGEMAVIPYPMSFNQSCYGLRAKKEIVDADYLYYLVKFKVKELKHNAHGSVFDTITRDTFEGIEVDIPSKVNQQKIASILAALDSKIETNETINHNLQQQAIALYHQIFCSSPHPDWKNGVLSDIAVVTMGQSPDGKSYNEDGVGTIFYQGRAEFGTRFPTQRLFTTEPKRMAQENDVLISVRAPVGDLNVAKEDCCIGRGLGSVRSKDGHQSFVLYTMFTLRSQFEVFNGEGTVFGSINRDSLNSIPIIIPTNSEIDKFEKLVSPMDRAIRANFDEICHLQSIRDSLLPRLMSGEIDVSEIEV